MHRAGENDAHVDQNPLAPLRALRHLDTSDARHLLHSSNSAHAPSRLHTGSNCLSLFEYLLPL